MGVLEKLGWKPPSSKQSGITEADTLYSDDVIKYVELYYKDEMRIIKHNINGTEADYRFQEPSKYTRPVAFNLKSDYYLNGSRIEDPKYNGKDAPLQIHCFGDSWTYGWDRAKERSFVN